MTRIGPRLRSLTSADVGWSSRAGPAAWARASSKAWLQAGARVIVPSGTQGRVDQFLRAAGDLDGDLHFVGGGYTSFDPAAELADRIIAEHGEIADVVASIGGWWQGKALWEVDEQDWQRWFVGLSTAHMAMARAWIPRLRQGGSSLLILGGSAVIPVPGASLMNMEQASLLMMQRVLAAEVGDQRRIGAEVLGAVATRSRNWVDPD